MGTLGHTTLFTMLTLGPPWPHGLGLILLPSEEYRAITLWASGAAVPVKQAAVAAGAGTTAVEVVLPDGPVRETGAKEVLVAVRRRPRPLARAAGREALAMPS